MTEEHDPNRLVGTVLGSRFEIISCAAIDEAGALYNAEDSELGTPASLRVLHRIRPDDASLRRLLELLTEVSNLSVPGIKPLRAVGRTRSKDVYYATDAVEGKSLAQRLDQGPLSVPDAVAALGQAGEILSRAHLAGVVHGALHPGALFIQSQAPTSKVQLLDFGLGPLVMTSNVLPSGSRSAATPYQSPEQAKSDPFDQRADIYALGALLYEALSGRQPFAGRSALEILAHQLRGEAPSLAEVAPSFEGSPLQNVIDQSMQVNPEDRFVSVDAMIVSLRNAGKQEATRKKPTPKPRTGRPTSGAGKKKDKGRAAAPVKKKSTASPEGHPVVTYVVGGLAIAATFIFTALWYTGALEPEVDESQLPTARPIAEDEGISTTAEPDPAPPPRRRLAPRPDPDEEPPPITSSKQPPPLPERALKLLDQGQEALSNKRYTQAITRFRAAKRLAPEAPQPVRGLGLAYMYSGQTRAAASELDRYLELSPDATDARFIRSTVRTLREN